MVCEMKIPLSWYRVVLFNSPKKKFSLEKGNLVSFLTVCFIPSLEELC